MTVAILNNTAVESDCSGCTGLSVDSLGRRFLQAIPGESITYTARILASAKVPLSVLGDDGVTLESDYNHCLEVDDPVHVCFTDGVCTPLALSPCLLVESVPANNQLTLKDADGNQVTMQPESATDPTPTVAGTPITGWIARAANLTGFRGTLTLRINDNRQDSLLGVGAIQNGRNQLQIKGHWAGALQNGDTLNLGPDYSGTVQAFRNVETCDGVPYTVAQMDTYGTADIPFTDGYFIYFCPESTVLEASSADPQCGWLTVTLPASETLKLLSFKTECIQAIGTWSFNLAWGVQTLPAHMQDKTAPVVWSHIFDSGTLLV